MQLRTAQNHLRRLLKAADEYAFKGAAHPEDWDAIQKEYDDAVAKMKETIATLHARQKSD